MSKPKILQEGQNYTFRSYFELPYETEDILAELGYSFSRARMNLPFSQHTPQRLPELRQQIEDLLPLVTLSSETARREILVAPVLAEVTRFCKCQMRVEYPLQVNSQLKGNLDYLLRNTHTETGKTFLVIEAKNDDLSRGFTQLAVELIALATAEEQDILYGAVTVGDTWRFGLLEQQKLHITQDITLYRVPDDLDVLMQILIGIIE
ncbi:hypothetical protein [Calothrix sp. NIES-3974]|uniref:hypothetical protein n=1 Tax=Calothrix sp. NIES-3974 TaxID=2005462 RepID=UPI000B60B976|nr:hypothetical protein [Calothrix sp. NIES-3974]BAZ06222.1 hypothetical protein NIES3974_28800 [Calothrix sp. NIES-3974]